MSDKKKRPPVVIITSPVLTLGKFPKLKTPDEYKGKRKYKAEGILSAADAAPIIAKIEALLPKAREDYDTSLADAAAKAKKAGKKFTAPEEKTHLPYYEVVDPDTGAETGDIAFKFSAQAEYEDQKTGETVQRTINHFTASGAKLAHKYVPELWGGSKVRIAYSMGAFGNLAAGMGVSLRIEAVKIIQPVKKGEGGDASRYGFDQSEDGWDGEEPSMGADESASEEATGGDGDNEAPAF